MNLQKTEYFFYAPIIGESKDAAEIADDMNVYAYAAGADYTSDLVAMQGYLDRIKMAMPGIHTDGIRINSRTV